MSSIIYVKTFTVLFVLLLTMLMVVFLLKKIKLRQPFQIGGSNRIKLLEIKRLDHNKSVVVFDFDETTYSCILAENYGLVLNKRKNGGEGRIRTYERTRRADLQSAAFGHSATSPEK